MVESAKPPAPKTDNPFILPGELPSLPSFSLPRWAKTAGETATLVSGRLRNSIHPLVARLLLITGVAVSGGVLGYNNWDNITAAGQGVIRVFEPSPINYRLSDFEGR